MENRVQIRRGNGAPGFGDLLEYELGYDRISKALYIRNEDGIEIVNSNIIQQFITDAHENGKNYVRGFIGDTWTINENATAENHNTLVHRGETGVTLDDKSYLTIRFDIGDTYVLSGYVKGTPNLVIELRPLNGSEPRIWTYNVVGDNYEYITEIFEIPAPGDYQLTLGGDGTETEGLYFTKLQIERGEKPTDWRPAPEDVGDLLEKIKEGEMGLEDLSLLIDTKVFEINQNLDGITSRVSDVEIETSGAMSKAEALENDLNSLIDDFELAKEGLETRITENSASLEILSTEVSTKVEQTVYDSALEAVDRSFTEVTQEIDSIRSTIQIGGGNNLIRNSVGYGGFSYWSLSPQDPTEGISIEAKTSTWILGGTSKHGWVGSSGILEQPINLLVNTDYTFSGRILKSTPAGFVEIGLYHADTDMLVHQIVRYEEPFDGSFSYQFNTGDIGRYKLVITLANASTTDPIEITDLMLAQGKNYSVWSQASGEVYTLNVKVDSNGINVLSADGRSRTVMSPEEFAGYYNDERIFTLNGDITEVMGLYVRGKGMYTPPVKFVQTDNSLDVVWTGWEVV